MSVWTYIGQIVNFIIFVVILYFLLYKPVRRILQQRKEEMEAELREAEKKLQEAENIRADAEQKAKELEETRDSVLKKAHDQAEAQRKELLQRAESQARDRLERFRRIMEQERSELLDKITDELRDTIVEVSGAALRDASGRLTDRGLERVESLLEEMSKQELERARTALAESQGRVTVRSSGALAEEQIEGLRNLLGTKLGVETMEIEVKEDPSLLAGLEVTVGHVHLEAHWRGVIDEALKARQAKQEKKPKNKQGAPEKRTPKEERDAEEAPKEDAKPDAHEPPEQKAR